MKVQLVAICALVVLGPLGVIAGPIIPGTLPHSLGAGDDVTSGLTPFGFASPGGISFLGTTSNGIYVNNNGNVTFGAPLSGFVEDGLATGVGVPIIAPFFGDVDTTGPGSGVTTFGNLTVNGHTAFVVDWTKVGYYSGGTDKLNTFQLVLSDRSDTGAGNFDMEFNYGQIQWETGSLNGGSDGLGGISASAGYSNGKTGNDNVFYELNGSLQNGALLDGGPDALISNSLGSSGVAGRYDFMVRDGVVSTGPPVATPEPLSSLLAGMGLIGVAALRAKRRR